MSDFWDNRTRADHLAWCKERALEYVDEGDLPNAFTSMVSDLKKHRELADHPGIMLGVMLMASGFLSEREEVRRFIEGFN